MKISARPLPTFLILGAQKCGTTSLHAMLSQHPEICMSEPKETNFFNRNFEKGLGYYSSTFFKRWDGQKAIGESSPPYLFLPYIPKRLAAVLPGVKMLVILRDPARRAFSHWWMNTTFGLESLSFKEAIRHSRKLSFADMEKASMCERFYLQAGYYDEQLERYFACFPREQFHIMFSDDLKHDPEAALKDVYRFIGVSIKDLPGDIINRLETSGPFASWIRRILRRLSMDNLIPSKTGYKVRRLLMALGDRPPIMNEEMSEWLIDHYRPHNRALQKMLNIDLRKWGA